MENISEMVAVMEKAVPDAAAAEDFESFEVCRAIDPREDPDLEDFCALSFVKLEVGDAGAATSAKRTGKKSAQGQRLDHHDAVLDGLVPSGEASLQTQSREDA
jgi:hypothetical protein